LMMAAIAARSAVLGLAPRSSRPRACPRASLAALSSAGLSRPTCARTTLSSMHARLTGLCGLLRRS